MTKAWHSFFGLVRAPERSVTIRVLIVASLLTVISWYFGADVVHSILFGVVLTTLGLMSFVDIGKLDVGNTDWRTGDGRKREGARSDVSELSWSLRGSYGRVGHRAMWRVRSLARQRLALYQLDLLDPTDRHKIEQLIGRRAYVVLARDARRPPWMHSFIHCLDALDALDPTLPAVPPSGSRRRSRIFNLHRPKESP